MSFIYRHRNKIFIIASILILIPFLFNIGLEVDEPFTMGLIRHNYGSIINLTALDIHPPLYYFVLKAFLSITTFWTTNIFIKIIFARLLSVIFSAIAFIYLHKILILLKINHNIYLEWLLFITLPFEIGLLTQTTNIRMYSLATLIFILVIYNLLKFYEKTSVKYLIGIYIFSTMSLYTHYFNGLIVGLFLICYIIMTIHNKWKNAVRVAFVGLLSLLSFIPWIPSLKLQLSLLLVGSHSHMHAVFPLHDVLLVMLVLIVFGIPAILKSRCKKLIYSLILTLIISFTINLTATNGAISPRYISSVAIVLEFIGINSIIINHKDYSSLYQKLAIILVTIFTLSSLALSFYNQMSKYVLPSVSFIQKFQSLKRNKDKTVNTKKAKINIYIWDSNGGNSIYLSSINKHISNKNYMQTNAMIGTGNVKLFKAVFPGIDHYVVGKPE